MKIIKRKKMRGFSLVELLISITLFTFVALVAVASLVSSAQLNNRLKVTRNLYESMYFTLEDIGRELKQGGSYELLSSSEVAFVPYQPYSTNFYRYKYALVGDTLHTFKDTGSGFVDVGQLSNDNIAISLLKFEIFGAGDFASGDRQQPALKIVIRGNIKTAPYTSFYMSSFVTQRDTDR